MRSTFALLLLFATVTGQAQDTTVVSTLTFDSITTRRGWWQFPPPTEQFRKVLMVHTLKCDPQTTQDGFDCGEWDYLTYHFIHEHTGALDSAALQHPYFKVGASAPDSVRTDAIQGFHQHQRWQRTATVQNVADQTLVTVGTTDTVDAASFITFKRRSQYRYTAQELITAGLVPGPIHELRFAAVPPGSALIARCTVRMKNASGQSLDRFDQDGLITVFDRPMDSADVHLVLSTPFVWDGTSDILVDIANEGDDNWSELSVQASHAAPGTALQELGPDNALRTGNDFIGIDPVPLAVLDDAVTITFRTFGDAVLPQNTTFLEAVGANGQRILNIHLPWSNGRVYWDAGSDGGNYDRIDKAATAQEFQGSWTEWAFVKNVTTGSMKIYRNGQLWHSATGKVLPLDGIVRMRVASDANGGNTYPGLIDGLQIFRVEVAASTIAEWYDRKVNEAHPDHAALLYSMDMDEPPFQGLPYTANAAGSDRGWLMGTVQRVDRPATELFRGASDPGVRPVITFGQGDYTIQVDSAVTTQPYTDYLPQLSREYFAVPGNAAVPIDTVFGYTAAPVYTYDPSGLVIDSSEAAGSTVLNDTLNYYGVPYEVVNDHEIGRYITPYGIGLDLGDEGFSWVYDVTEYQHLLHDSVELSAGNQQELIDLKFLMIGGTPPRPVVNVQRPWGPMRSFSYASLSNDQELASTTVDLHPDATQWMLRSRLTGHGHNSNDGNYPHCCEWKDNTHYLRANGQLADQWHIWQEIDCANNPVYPQGGTWLGSREGWCPGDLVKDRDTELTGFVTGEQITLDYDITPVPQNNLGMGGGNYVVNMDLFEFGEASHAVDAEILDVRRPNDSGYRSRENPICNDPVIVLRNAGSTPLTSVTFAYQVGGGTSVSHTWTGDLAHMERIEVTLPIGSPQFWAGDGENNFSVTITEVNNAGPDDYLDNDSYRTHFNMPVTYSDNIVFWYKTNNRPQENDLFVRDMFGNVVYSRTSFVANTIYRDTLQLPPGCYEMEFTDAGNDGLSYWADPAAGSGWFRFRSLGGSILRTFEPEFGHRIHAAFGIGTITGISDHVPTTLVTAIPNPSDGVYRLQLEGAEGPVTLDVLDATGRLVRSSSAVVTGNGNVPLDLTAEPAGLYTVRIVHSTGFGTVRLIKR